MSLEVRPCANLAEFTDATMAIGQYFGNEGDPEKTRALHTAASARANARGLGGRPHRRRRGRLSVQLSVPGGTVPCGGTTVVGVAPTHRRRGVLRAMMRAHLDDVHERGEPIAALWASEETIYGRFGYGPAAYAGESTFRRSTSTTSRRASVRGGSDSSSRDEALEAFPPLWDALGARATGDVRPLEGLVGDANARRSARAARRSGPEALRAARGRRCAGRLRDLPAQDGLGGRRRRAARCIVVEAIGADPAALARAAGASCSTSTGWRRSRRGSCRPTIRCSSCCVSRGGCAIGWATGCGCGSSTSAPRLPARTYPDRRRARVRRARRVLPVERGAVAARGGKAERTDAAADLALDVSTLGSAYLGGIRFAQLAQGGRVEELTAGRGRACRRHLPPRPASVVPGDLLRAWARLFRDPGG